jgi:hypothetical protein
MSWHTDEVVIYDSGKGTKLSSLKILIATIIFEVKKTSSDP